MLSHQHSLVAASTSKSGAPTVDCDLAIKSIPFQQLRDPYASGEVLEGSDTDSDDELTAGGSFTLKRPAIVDRTTTRGIDTDMDSSDSELDDSDFEDGPQATRSILLNRPTEPQANIGHLHMLDRDLATAETPEALSELSVLIADRLTLFEAATIAGELPAPPKITRVEVKAIENELQLDRSRAKSMAKTRNWQKRHQDLIGVQYRKCGTKTVYNATHSRHQLGYRNRETFRCQRGGELRTKSVKRKPGTKAEAPASDGAVWIGDRRKKKKGNQMTKTSIKIGCTSEFVARKQEKTGPGIPPTMVYEITYAPGHNHSICSGKDEYDIGTNYLSPEAKERICALLENGASVREVLQRLQSSRSRFAQLGRTRVFRDDVITYEDVYNVNYQLMLKEIRKDDNEDRSAELWMRQLFSEGYHTCYYPGKYYGFSSPWQLQQLRDNGKIFCFDGTHHVYGYVLYFFFAGDAERRP
ncbi:MAG: hypothetical protein BYD32DRAFT_489142 [Podila humilis]|nr:MAG: hypothetical protein BYD32DRAFT_489142 [Podila humilis]